MKFALWLLVCCILVITGTVLMAPEYAHEIIDKLQGKPIEPNIPQVDQSNEGNSNNDNDTGTTPGQEDESGTVVESPTPAKVYQPIDNPDESGTEVEPPTPPQRIKQPRTRVEMLTWLHDNDYSVAHEQGFYRITWVYRKPSSIKPTAVIVSENGKVTFKYEKYVVIYENNASIIGHNINVRGKNNYTTAFGTITKVKNGLIKTISMEYESGYWWVVITNSFDWVPGQDRIENVWLQAKQIKMKHE